MSIDHGRPFDFGRVSSDYAKYRDIYPQELYRRLRALEIGCQGQSVLDLGTGTGVLPRNLAPYGARFVGIDLSAEQIRQAELLSRSSGGNIRYLTGSAEEISFPDTVFDAVTACQCFFYFDHTRLAPKLFRILKPEGKLAIIYMAWLPFEDKIAGASEQLVLRYHPDWTGGGEIRHPIEVDSCYKRFFTCENECVFDVSVPFTRESWAGRIRACRGIGASLSPEQVQEFDSEHKQLLRDIAPEQFSILHYCAVTVLKKRSFVHFPVSHKNPLLKK